MVIFGNGPVQDKQDTFMNVYAMDLQHCAHIAVNGVTLLTDCRNWVSLCTDLCKCDHFMYRLV